MPTGVSALVNAARPIVVWHRSAHEVILNSAALTLLGITADLVAALPAAALAQTSFEDGYFYETGSFAIMPKLAPLLATPERLTAGLELTRDYLHRSGITMACEPGGVLSRPLQEVQNKILAAAMCRSGCITSPMASRWRRCMQAPR